MNVNVGEIWFFDAKGEDNRYQQYDRIYEFKISRVEPSFVYVKILKDSCIPESVGREFMRDKSWLFNPCYKKKLIHYNQYWAKLNE